MSDDWDHIYRIRQSLRNLGIVCVVCFVGMAILSATVAALNIDGSFKRPILAAVVFSSAFGSFSLMGWWLLLTYHRYRLYLSSSAIRQDGAIKSYSVSILSIHEAQWRLRPKGGSIVLLYSHGQFKIEFDPFTLADRDAIIAILRDTLPAQCHRNWNEFNERFVAASPQRQRQQIRAEQTLLLAVLAFALVFGVAGFAGLGNEYFMYSAVNLAGFVWLRSNKRQPPGDNQAGQQPFRIEPLR